MTHIMFQTTGHFITKSIFFSYFHLRHKTEIQVCYTLDSREISRENNNISWTSSTLNQLF